MGSVFGKKDGEIEGDIVISFYLYYNYDIVAVFKFVDIKDFEKQKSEFIKEYHIWDKDYEEAMLKQTKQSNKGFKFKFIDKESVRMLRLKYQDKYYYIKSKVDMAWVEANWDLFEEEESNYSLTFKGIQSLYIKINENDEKQFSDESYKRNLSKYKDLRTQQEMNKINSHII